MPAMKSPYAGKPVSVSDEMVDRFAAAGFVLVEDKKPAEPVEKKAAPKRKSGK